MNKAIRLVLALLALIGIGAAIGKAFIWGDAVVNYGSYVPWGLWVSLYAFLVGVAAGAAWFGFYMGSKNNSLGWVKLGYSTAAISLVGALAFIGLDLGKPMKGISIFFSPSFSSPLAWASWGYALFIIAVLVFLFKGAESTKSPIVWVALVASVLFLAAETLFFSGMIARPLWNSWSNGVAFITSALASGGAMVYGIAHLTAPQLIKESAGLRKLVLYTIVLHILVGVGHSALESKIPEGMAQVTDWKYWVLFVGLGAVAAFLFSKPTLAAWGSLLALLSIIAYKVSFVSAAFTEAAFPQLPQAFQSSRLSLVYFPSTVEWLVAVGLLSLVLLSIIVVMPKVLDQSKVSGKSNSVKA